MFPTELVLHQRHLTCSPLYAKAQVIYSNLVKREFAKLYFNRVQAFNVSNVLHEHLPQNLLPYSDHMIYHMGVTKALAMQFGGVHTHW